MPPNLPSAISAAGTGSSPEIFSFAHPVAAGSHLSVLVADAFGNVPVITAVTDTQGNTYQIDTAVNQADGAGSVYVAHSRTTAALSLSDSLTVEWDGGTWDSFYLVATAFTDAGDLVTAGTPHGAHTTGAPVGIAATADGAGIAIGYAAYQTGPVSSDPGWATFLDNIGDSNNVIVGAWKTAAGPVEFDTVNEDAPASDGYGASVVCIYTSVTPVDTSPPSLTAGVGQCGIVF